MGLGAAGVESILPLLPLLPNKQSPLNNQYCLAVQLLSMLMKLLDCHQPVEMEAASEGTNMEIVRRFEDPC